MATSAPSSDHLAIGDIIAVVGATATGKTALSLDLAEALSGEIVNADALQFYRGMDIGTAKVRAEERRGIPHHLFDVLDVTEEASVSTYQQHALTVIADIHRRGRVAILVGGSGLYLRAVLDHLAFPPTDSVVRSRWEAEITRRGAQALHRELAERDPEAAQMIGGNDARRIVRALEVGELTGKSFTAFLPRYEYASAATLQIAPRWSRDDLHQRVAQRVHSMMEEGFLAEVRELRAHGLDSSVTAKRAIGYQQMLQHLDGQISLERAVEDTIAGTRRLVRKQDTWFRRDPRIHWCDVHATSAPENLTKDALSTVQAWRAERMKASPEGMTASPEGE